MLALGKFELLELICDKFTLPSGVVDTVDALKADGHLTHPRDFTLVLKAFQTRCMWENALKMLAEMRECNVEPNIITYGTTVSTCGKGRQWELAVEMLADARAFGLELDAITYASAISASEKCKLWEQAHSQRLRACC